MLALRAILALALATAVSALPTDMVAEESGVSQWNEGAIAIGMFSGGRRRRAGDDGSSGPTPQRQRRQEDLSEDFSADEYDGDLDMKKKVTRMRRQAPRRGIESPFGPTSDVEDRVRRAAQDSSQEHGLEDNDHVDNDHFPTEDEGKRTRRTSEDAYFDDSEGGDDDDEVTIDLAPFAPKKKRQVVGQDVATDDDEDVYRDLDDQPLPVWARGTRDGRQRRQLDQAMPSMDDDQPDYIRESRDLETATAASSTEGSDAAIQAPERDQTTAGPVKAANTATEESGEKAVESVATEVPQEGGEKLTTTTTPAPTSSSTHTIDSVMRDDESGTAEAGSSSSLESPSSETDSTEQPPRARRAPQPQRGRFEGFVLSDFSGFRSGRSVRARRSEPSEAALIKTLLEAPIDESILGELPVRRPRQITEAMPQPASGGPVTYLVPLVAPQPPSAQDEDAVNDAVPQKVLQIYTAHQPVPVVADMIPTTTTTAAPPPAEPLVPVLVPESAVSGILVPDNVPVRVEVIPPDAAPAADQPVVVQPALLQPAVPVAQPTPVQHPDATMPTQHSPQQAQPLLVLQPGPVIIDPVTPVSPVKPQAPQGQQVPLEIPQEVSLTKQEAPQAAKDAALAPVVVSQTAHTVAVPEGADAGSATQPDGSIPMPSPQEPLAQPAPLEWFPAAPMNPAPFEAQNQAPPRQHFDVNLTPSVDTSRWTATVPILEKTIQLHPDGSYVYSYETADGVRVAEAGVLKEVPVRPEEGSAKAAVPATVLANSVQGGYSYTAPDGTYVSLRYVADENGFQPVLGESLPTANKNKARAAVRFDENK